MRRTWFIAIVVMLILSLGCGIAFADDLDDADDLRLSEEQIIFAKYDSSEGTIKFNISGKLVNEYGRKIYETAKVVVYNPDGDEVTTGWITKGDLDLTISNNNSAFDEIGKYKISVYDPYDEDKLFDTYLEFVYALSLEDVDIEYMDENVVIQGEVKNAYGEGVEDAEIHISGLTTDESNFYGDNITTKSGSFGFIVKEVLVAGDVEVEVEADGYTFVGGALEIEGREMDLEVKGPAFQNIPFTFILSAEDEDGDEVAEETDVTYYIDLDGDEEFSSSEHFADAKWNASKKQVVYSWDDIDTDELEFDDGIAWFKERGTYMIMARTEDGGYSGQTELEVKQQQKVTLIGVPASVTVGDDEDDLTFEMKEDIKIVMSTDDDFDQGSSIDYVATATGCGVDWSYDPRGLDSEVPDDTDDLVILPGQAGEVEITVKRYDKEDGEWHYTASETTTIEVQGGNYTISTTELTADKKKDVDVRITKDGDPLNNMCIYFVKSGTIDYGDVDELDEDIAAAYIDFTSNPNNGEYELEDLKISEPGYYDLIAVHYGSTIEVWAQEAITVLGEEVFEIKEVTPTELIAGLETEITFQVEDQAGHIVFPDQAEIVVDGQIESLNSYNIVDLDDDGEDDAYRYLYTGVSSDEDVIIQVYEDGDEFSAATRIGMAEIPVSTPQLTVAKATNYFKSPITLQVVNPLDDELVDIEVKDLRINYGQIKVYDEDGDDIDVDDLYTDDEVTFYVLPEVTEEDWEEAQDDDSEVAITVVAELGTSDEEITFENAIEVADATVTIDPENLVVNMNNQVTVTLRDANNHPLVDYEVILGDYESETNGLGQAVFALKPYSMATLVVEVENDGDDEEYYKGNVKVGEDFIAPTIEYPEITNKNTADIIIRDNVRVSRVRINNVEQDIFPLSEVTCTVNLTKGVNTFTIQAIDNSTSLNLVEKTITITYDPSYVEPQEPQQPDDSTPTPAPGEATVQIGVDSGYGPPILLDGTTMVPVRVAERDLGATMEWVSSTKTAIYTLGDREIQVTIGNAYATVIDNGKSEKVLMPVAPQLIEGRTFVPLRMIAQELGFSVTWSGNDKPIIISK